MKNLQLPAPTWRQEIVPFTMKITSRYCYSLHLILSYPCTGLIWSFIQFGRYCQSFCRFGIADQIHYRHQAFQWATPPILSNVIEQSVLYFVPFTSSRREMPHMNNHCQLIRKPLKFQLPQTNSRTIAATATSRYQWRNSNLLKIMLNSSNWRRCYKTHPCPSQKGNKEVHSWGGGF